MKRAGLLLVGLLLGACASQAPVPASSPSLELPLQLHVQRRQADQVQDWLLVIQREDSALRWSLLDPLGLPLARQRLEQGQWRNDGLLPPNLEARELFAALLFALSPRAELPRLYAGLDWQAEAGQRSLDQGQRHWRVSYRQSLDFDLRLGDDLHYGVAPLATQEDSRP
ncbi:MAG TPA: DUF3261 domain-containing protein [Pseudomonas sp.]|nr:DUF3261 domain-containing protein [Pseudomonas sp.]